MSHYDDERVIALLHETVPEVPDAPHRLDMIRHKAGRQRATLWTQTLGAVTGVLVVVGMAAAVSVPSGGAVEPSSRPIDALTDAFTKADSVRFEATVKPVGDLTEAQAAMAKTVSANVTGAATKNGSVRVDGDVAFGMLFGRGNEDASIRIVDGAFYRSVSPYDFAPDGTRWVREDGDVQTTVGDLVRLLRLAEAFAEDVRYVGPTTVRGVSAAEYRLRAPIPDSGTSVEVTFAIDSQDRLRRVASTFAYGDVLGQAGFGGPHESAQDFNFDISAELLLFGYGDDVDIEAPPAAETMTSEQVYEAGSEEREAAMERYSDCMQAAGDSDDMQRCAKEAGFPGPFGGPLPGEHAVPDGPLVCGPPTPTTSSYVDCTSSTVGTGWVSVDGSPPPPPPPASTASPAP